MKMIKRVCSSRNGSTMIETLVAFAVIMSMIAMFTKTVMVASRILVSTQNTITNMETFSENYYKKRSRDDKAAIEISLVENDNQGNVILKRKSSSTLGHPYLGFYQDGSTGWRMYSYNWETGE